MRRFLLATLAIFSFSLLGMGCQNVARLGCECKDFYLDIQRNIFGIDYPHGASEFPRGRYIGIEPPGHQPICDD